MINLRLQPHLDEDRAALALNVGIDGATFIFKKFWPDLNRAIFYTKS
jgi:hypothetical protein